MKAIETFELASALFAGLSLWRMKAAADVGAEVGATGEGPTALRSAAEAKAIVARARGVYASLQGYSDWSEFVTVYETEYGDNPVPVKARLVYSKPYRFVVELDESSWFGPGGLVCDGITFSEYAINSGAYVQKPVTREEDVSYFDDRDEVTTSAPWHLGLLLTGADSPELLFEWIRTLEGCREEVRNGRSGKRVIARGSIPCQPATVEPDVDWSMWFDDETGLLGEVVLDMTKRQQKLAQETGEGEEDQTPVKRFASILTLRDVTPNPQIADDIFEFKAAEGAVRVERFRSPADRVTKFAGFLGAPAPDFEAATATEGKFRLSDLKGKVVVLDFWATWCGPCDQAMPQLQKISDLMREEAVVFVGVNQDREMSANKLREWLGKKQVSMVQVMDGTCEISRSYGVGGIPHVVVIDQKGVVQAVEVGFGGKEFAAKLERTIRNVLAGEAVYNPEQIAALKEANQNPSDVGVLRWARRSQSLPEGVAKCPEKNAGWIDVRGKSAFGLNRNRFVECDLGPAGGIVLVWPSSEGAASIVQYRVLDHTSRRVFLKDIGARSVMAAFAYPAGKETRYLVCSSRSVPNSWTKSQLMVSCHDATGSPLWKYEPPLAGEYDASVGLFAADLWGSGTVHPMVAINARFTKKIKENSYVTIGTYSRLLVFDEGGELLVSKAIGALEAPIIRRVENAGGGAAEILLVSEGQIDRIELPQRRAP